MPGTQITPTRTPVLVDTGTKYQVTAVCSLAGTLPNTNIFVRQVVQEDDPKNDTFLRIASVVDFTTYGSNRQESIESGAFIYRANSFVALYDDVTTGNDAWNELSARVNALVLEYDVYITAFLTPVDGVVVTYPTIDESTKAALIATYEASLETVEEAESARDTENVACNALQLELETYQIRLAEVQADVAAVTPIASASTLVPPNLSVIAATTSTASLTASAYVASSGASAPEQASIQGQLATINNQVSALNLQTTFADSEVRIPLLAFLGTLQARAASLQADVTAKQIEYNQCMLEMATLQAAVDQARQARDAALAAIVAVCPDYVPT